MDTAQLGERLVDWIRDKVVEARCRGTVLGLSGGVDSAVVAVLCKRAFPESTLAVMMPCHSVPQDEEHSRLVVDKFSIPTRLVVLDNVYDALSELLPDEKKSPEAMHLARSNLKVRLRMIILYYLANQLQYLVVGSSNRSELTVGYFTKYGDGGIDIAPLGNLVKAQVRDMAMSLDIPREIIDKPPSAGLWPGQTDEAELGLSYEEIDRYLLTGEASVKVREKIETKMATGHHKRQPPMLPDF
ncbi:MAG: NAD(+) synthase [Dehalococcoidales bacterium]|nr:MAG: NAD(+) synthase [Dehalococcoidales bacterium]